MDIFEFTSIMKFLVSANTEDTTNLMNFDLLIVLLSFFREPDMIFECKGFVFLMSNNICESFDRLTSALHPVVVFAMRRDCLMQCHRMWQLMLTNIPIAALTTVSKTLIWSGNSDFLSFGLQSGWICYKIRNKSVQTHRSTNPPVDFKTGEKSKEQGINHNSTVFAIN